MSNRLALKYPNPRADGLGSDVDDRLPSPPDAAVAAVKPKDPVVAPIVVVVEEDPVEKEEKKEYNGEVEEEGFRS